MDVSFVIRFSNRCCETPFDVVDQLVPQALLPDFSAVYPFYAAVVLDWSFRSGLTHTLARHGTVRSLELQAKTRFHDLGLDDDWRPHSDCILMIISRDGMLCFLAKMEKARHTNGVFILSLQDLRFLNCSPRQ